MKRVMYTMPAVMIGFLYSMIALLAGGFAAFQLKAWLIIVMPLVSAVLLLAGRWWGSIPGMLLGGFLIGLNTLQAQSAADAIQTGGGLTFDLVMGIVFFVYYMIAGIVCLKDAQKKQA